MVMIMMMIVIVMAIMMILMIAMIIVMMFIWWCLLTTKNAAYIKIAKASLKICIAVVACDHLQGLFEGATFWGLGAHHQISGERVGSFFVQDSFFGSFWAARFFFWPMLAFFSEVALLQDFFLLVCHARFFFW